MNRSQYRMKLWCDTFYWYRNIGTYSDAECAVLSNYALEQFDKAFPSD